jgi:hypothetical protein
MSCSLTGDDLHVQRDFQRTQRSNERRSARDQPTSGMIATLKHVLWPGAVTWTRKEGAPCHRPANSGRRQRTSCHVYPSLSGRRSGHQTRSARSGSEAGFCMYASCRGVHVVERARHVLCVMTSSHGDTESYSRRCIRSANVEALKCLSDPVSRGPGRGTGATGRRRR